MAEGGMDAVRLNFSHGDHASHRSLIDRVAKVASDAGRAIPVIMDLQGPRFRVGALPDGYLDLKRGMEITLAGRRDVRGEIRIRPDFAFGGVKAGHRVAIGDLGISLRVRSVGRGHLRCRVAKGGTVHEGKGIVFPQSKAALPAITEKDIRDLRFGKRQGVAFVALSFVRNAQDVADLRRRIGKHDIGIISKIETREALKDIDAIIDESDAVLVARGDLASEVSISRLPVVQKLLIEKCNSKAKPVITATQMLESMISNPQPTRAEASDVANAVLDGSDTLMLSGETAIGNHPVEATRVMASIIKRTEEAHAKSYMKRTSPMKPKPQIDETIAYLAADAAARLGAKAIITFTMTGSTARRVAKFRPAVPIFAVSPSEPTRMRLGISHGVVCGAIGRTRGTDDMIEAAIASAESGGIVSKGDVVVVTAGVPPLTEGKTNLL
jgi:pyruvate kinase